MFIKVCSVFTSLCVPSGGLTSKLRFEVQKTHYNEYFDRKTMGIGSWGLGCCKLWSVLIRLSWFKNTNTIYLKVKFCIFMFIGS